MALGIARHVLRAAWAIGRLARPPARGPAPPLSPPLRAELAQAGLTPGTIQVEIARPHAGEIGRLSLETPPTPHLILAEITLRGDTATATLTGSPQAHLPSGATILARIAPTGGHLTLAIRPDSAWSRLDIHRAAAIPIPPDLQLDRLIPRAPLAPDPDWERAYAPAQADDWRGQLIDHTYQSLTHQVQIPWLENLQLNIAPGIELYRAILRSGLYEPDLMLALARHLPKGGRFLDVGANAGIFSLFAAARLGPSGQVIALEPSAREFAQLTGNIALNNLANVTPHRAAADSQPGTLQLHIADPGHAGHNSLADLGDATIARESVPAVTIDDLLATADRCDAIKLDIEGAELRALQGATKTLSRLRPALAIEINPQSLIACGTSAEALLGFLAAQNYTAHDIDPATATKLPTYTTEPHRSKNILALPRAQKSQ